MRINLLAVALACAVISVQAQGFWRDAKTVHFKVVDESNAPVTNAYINAYSMSTAKPGQGFTDANGVFSYKARAIFGAMSCSVQKSGYYETKGAVWSASGSVPELPTNSFTLVLKRMINPVRMTRRRVEVCVPVLDEAIGFDMAVGALVQPYGKGKIADVWIAGLRNQGGPPRDFYATMTVSNSLDGFVPYPVVRSAANMSPYSGLQPPQRAPDTGYTNMLGIYSYWQPGFDGRESSDDPWEYAFRVRCETNGLGEVIHANVGWFSAEMGGFRIRNQPQSPEVAKKSIIPKDRNRVYIAFTYYYNPNPLSRSLEPKSFVNNQIISWNMSQVGVPYDVTAIPPDDYRGLSEEDASTIRTKTIAFMDALRAGDTNACAKMVGEYFGGELGSAKDLIRRMDENNRLIAAHAAGRSRMIATVYRDVQIHSIKEIISDFPEDDVVEVTGVVEAADGSYATRRKWWWQFRAFNGEYILVNIRIGGPI
jgi:hypothetical protein